MASFCRTSVKMSSGFWWYTANIAAKAVIAFRTSVELEDNETTSLEFIRYLT